ncbi:MAG: type 2 isopentenyl-diphosphate Delta-isomerase [Anaerolineae bacterium]|nr:type 2 isopentenyl-diphosphate Delta-isomerase [Anaerolineae bacterium]
MEDSPRLTKSRKQDHIEINLNKNVQSGIATGFDHFHFNHNPLPEINFQSISTESDFLGKTVQSPILISSMTGGTADGLVINRNLAKAAQLRGIALALGSGRAGLDSVEAAKTYQLRKWAPSIPIYANLGAIQLNYGFGVDECKRVVEMAEANALILHLNSLQEALQPEGQTNYAGLLKKINEICKAMAVPVIAKEVGWGINALAARRLADAGVSCIDVAGAGGTSWSEVEKHRNSSEARIRISSHFYDWGMPTAEAVIEVCQALPDVPVIASGGLRKGLDIAKSLALGASMGGIAGGFLRAATKSSEEVVNLIDELNLELRIAMFAVGAGTIEQLKQTPINKAHLND